MADSDKPGDASESKPEADTPSHPSSSNLISISESEDQGGFVVVERDSPQEAQSDQAIPPKQHKFRSNHAAEWLSSQSHAAKDAAKEKIAKIRKKLTDEGCDLYGNLKLTIHEARGLPTPTVLYVRIMIDKIKGPRTGSLLDANPRWDQDFDIPVAGVLTDLKLFLKEEG